MTPVQLTYRNIANIICYEHLKVILNCLDRLSL